MRRILAAVLLAGTMPFAAAPASASPFCHLPPATWGPAVAIALAGDWQPGLSRRTMVAGGQREQMNLENAAMDRVTMERDGREVRFGPPPHGDFILRAGEEAMPDLHLPGEAEAPATALLAPALIEVTPNCPPERLPRFMANRRMAGGQEMPPGEATIHVFVVDPGRLLVVSLLALDSGERMRAEGVWGR